MTLRAIFVENKTFLVKLSFCPEPFKARVSRVDVESAYLPNNTVSAASAPPFGHAMFDCWVGGSASNWASVMQVLPVSAHTGII
jgi:hypothetical protein